MAEEITLNNEKNSFWEKGEKKKFAIFSIFMSFIWMKYADNLSFFYKRGRDITDKFETIIYQYFEDLNLEGIGLFIDIFLGSGAIFFIFFYWLTKQIFSKYFWRKFLLSFVIVFFVNFLFSIGQCFHPDLLKYCPPFEGKLSNSFSVAADKFAFAILFSGIIFVAVFCFKIIYSNINFNQEEKP